MNIHKNARLTPLGRERLVWLVESGQTPEAVARSAGVCPRTVRKWLVRYRAEGVAGLQDRSSRPHRLHCPTPAATLARIEALRRQRFTGQQIARDLGVSPATVSRVLRRLGLNRMAALEPAVPVRRYERERPGELIHVDIKKLGRFDRTGHRITGDRAGQSNSRGIGWEYLHLAVDDHSRLAFSQILPDEKRGSCLTFLFNALRFWAYAKAYETSEQRSGELDAFLLRYNWQRPHMSLKAMPPVSRLGPTENNLLSLHS